MDKIHQLNFTTNWNNKLACHAFTTIRLWYEGRFQKGQEVEILLQKKHLKYAIIIDIKIFQLHQLNNFMALLDTGYTVEKTKDIIRTMYKNKIQNIEHTLFAYILLETIKK